MSTLDEFRLPVESLTDAELVAQWRVLLRVKARRRRRERLRVEAVARRLLASLDEPDSWTSG
jgi:hypothetical protein